MHVSLRLSVLQIKLKWMPSEQHIRWQEVYKCYVSWGVPVIVSLSRISFFSNSLLGKTSSLQRDWLISQLPECWKWNRRRRGIKQTLKEENVNLANSMLLLPEWYSRLANSLSGVSLWFQFGWQHLWTWGFVFWSCRAETEKTVAVRFRVSAGRRREPASGGLAGVLSEWQPRACGCDGTTMSCPCLPWHLNISAGMKTVVSVLVCHNLTVVPTKAF